MADKDSARRRLAFQKSYSLEHGGSWRHRSLIEDAKFDTLTNVELERQKLGAEGGAPIPREDDEVFDKLANGDQSAGLAQRRKCELMFGVPEAGGLSRVFKTFENNRVTVNHVETRKSAKKGSLEFFTSFEGVPDDVINAVKSLKQSSTTRDVSVVSESDVTTKTIWIPTHISDLDECQHLLTKFDPDLDQGHPGFTDKEYRMRRSKIANLAFEYKFGKQIPRVEYTTEEIRTWGIVLKHLIQLYPTHACRECVDIFQVLQAECGYSEHNIPQLQDVSDFLKKRTGFQLRPVAGLLSARDFLASLAFRVFQCTQYVRHGSKPDHTVEPDVVHELLGHVPMLADPVFAEFSQEIGLASLGASDDDIEKFSTLYWFTVEFGLCKQDGQVRAYGAGLLSAYGELQHALSESPEVRPFDPATTALQSYDDQDYQTTYFLAESFPDMKEKVRQYAKNIHRPHELRYDALTQRIEVLDNKAVLNSITRALRTELDYLQCALSRMDAVKLN